MTTQDRNARVIELIGQIYEAALDPAGWSTVVQGLGDTFGGGAAFVANDPSCRTASLSGTANFHPDYLRSYVDHYGKTSPWIREYLRLPVGSLLHWAVAPQLRLETTEYYNDWLKPQRLKDALGGVLSKSGSRLSYAVVLRAEHLGEFTEQDKQTFQLVFRNITRALSVHTRLAQQSAVGLALFDALDRAGLAAFVVSEDRQLLAHNMIAEAMLKESAVVRLAHGAMLARHPTADIQLERAVKVACRMRQGETVILTQVGSESRPSVGLVMPIKGDTDRVIYLTSSNRRALVLVKDPSRSPQSSLDILRKLFGLTTAEARLMGELADGRSLEEISEQRSVRYSTLRAQLRTIMHKTDTKRQGELIAVALRHTALNVTQHENRPPMP